MRDEETIVIKAGADVVENVAKRIRTAGVRGLSTEKASELGVFNRLSFLLCAMHSSICAAYRIYGGVDYLLTEMGSKRHEIKKACCDFEAAYDKFVAFWRGYQTKEGVMEMNDEVEALFHQIMRWAQLPEDWQLGDVQHTDDDTDVLIKIDADEKLLKLHRATVESEAVGDVEEEYCVLRYEDGSKQQHCVERGMDRASAQMVAKRMSADDTAHIYTAAVLQTMTERRVDIMPIKAYKANKTIGNIRKVFK